MSRSTSLRDRHRKAIAQGRPACGICGHPIDYSLPHLDPYEYVVDHVIPVNGGGTDTLDNKQAAHRVCNRSKSDRLDGGTIIRKSGSLQAPRGAPPPPSQ